jgi:hypothetical protein
MYNQFLDSHFRGNDNIEYVAPLGINLSTPVTFASRKRFSYEFLFIIGENW